MKNFQVWDANGDVKGPSHPVSDEFYAKVVDAFPGMERMTLAQVEATRRDLMAVSNLRPLTQKELENVRACDAVRNLNATHRALNGRDVQALYGETVAVDRIKFTDWTPDTCGCTHQFIWHRDHPAESRAHHPHRVVRACGRHALTRHSPNIHHAALMTENQAKNVGRAVEAERLGVPLEEIVHEIDANDVITFKHVTKA